MSDDCEDFVIHCGNCDAVLPDLIDCPYCGGEE